MRRILLEPVREHIESSESFVQPRFKGTGLIRLGRVVDVDEQNRGRYDRSRLRYPSNLTDEEWALVEPVIPPAKRSSNR